MAQARNPQNTVVKSIRQEKDHVILELTGDIDLHHSVELRQNLLEVMEKKPKGTIINMSQVGFMDSSGLATLVEALQLSRRYGGLLKLVGLQQRVKSIFEISRLDTIFKMYGDETEALV
jgi:anti-sigma B factor antagonist